MELHKQKIKDLDKYYASDKRAITEVEKASIKSNLRLKYEEERKSWQWINKKSSEDEIQAIKNFFNSDERLSRTLRNEKFKDNPVIRNEILSKFIEIRKKQGEWEDSQIDDIYERYEGFERDVVRNIIFTIQFRNEQETIDFKNNSGAYQYAILFKIWKILEAGIYDKGEIINFLMPGSDTEKLLIYPYKELDKLRNFSSEWHPTLRDFIPYNLEKANPPLISPKSIIENWFNSMDLVLLPIERKEKWIDDIKKIYRKEYYKEGFRLGWKKEVKENFYTNKIKEKMKKREPLIQEELLFLQSKKEYWIRRIKKPDYMLRDFFYTLEMVQGECTLNGIGTNCHS